MEANYVHKDSTTLIQDKLVKNELNQIELQYNALKQQKFNELLKENKELKKQLEEKEYIACNWKDSCLDNAGKIEKLENQQKEFIEYLEDLIKQNETVVEVSKYGLPKNCSKLLIAFYKGILSKYKEIIGDDK